MDSLNFLYWALAIGFLVLVFFSCIALFHVIRILRDFADTSSSVKDTAIKMNENVKKISDKVTETAEQISEYVIKPFSVIQYLTDKVKPVMEMVQEKGEEWIKHAAKGESADDEKPKKKRRFGRKK